jgi:hypothetical protein
VCPETLVRPRLWSVLGLTESRSLESHATAAIRLRSNSTGVASELAGAGSCASPRGIRRSRWLDAVAAVGLKADPCDRFGHDRVLDRAFRRWALAVFVVDSAIG